MSDQNTSTTKQKSESSAKAKKQQTKGVKTTPEKRAAETKKNQSPKYQQ